MNRSPLCDRYALHTTFLWAALAWLFGFVLVLALPINLPGAAVPQVQELLVHLNLHDLYGKGALPFLLVLLSGAGVGALLFGFGFWLVAHPPRASRPAAPARRWAWLRYTLPMLLIWGITLLTFWPALLSKDSFDQWRQVQTLQFENGHPLLHTLFLWLISRVWDSFSMVALVQILALALVVAWGLSELRRYGLPGWAAWSGAALFALSPVNATLTISIWKDIPYSIAVLALSLLLLFIALDEERWLRKRFLWLGLGLLVIVIGLFRLNGIVILPPVFLMLALLYRRHWRTFAYSLALFITAWLVVQFPLQSALHVAKNSSISASIALHHIAAHLHNQDKLSPADEALVAHILPLDQWNYTCYQVNPILFHPQLNQDFIQSNQSAINNLALRLFLRHPTVDFEHMACAGSLIFQVWLPWEGYFYTMQVYRQPDGVISYVSPNDLNLHESSLLPGLADPLVNFLGWTTLRPINGIFWRPATYLYLLLFLGAVFLARVGSGLRALKVALFLFPALVQTFTLFLVNIAQTFRYQYAVYLLALFAVVLLFLPIPPGEKEQKVG